jgi:hypothetical protein
MRAGLAAWRDPLTRAEKENAGHAGVFFKPVNSDCDDLGGAGPFLAFADFVFDLLAVVQGRISFGLYFRVVYKQVLAAIFRGDETIALGGIEPLNRAGTHIFWSLLCNEEKSSNFLPKRFPLGFSEFSQA